MSAPCAADGAGSAIPGGATSPVAPESHPSPPLAGRRPSPETPLRHKANQRASGSLRPKLTPTLSVAPSPPVVLARGPAAGLQLDARDHPQPQRVAQGKVCSAFRWPCGLSRTEEAFLPWLLAAGRTGMTDCGGECGRICNTCLRRPDQAGRPVASTAVLAAAGPIAGIPLLSFVATCCFPEHALASNPYADALWHGLRGTRCQAGGRREGPAVPDGSVHSGRADGHFGVRNRRVRGV